MEDVERRVIGKVMRRLIPFLILCYFVAYLDRVNVSFAKLHMNQALGFSEAAFGLGAGLFFIAYFLFEVPSNIFLERVGARVWIARIMISWGIVSAAFAFIPSIVGSDRSFERRGFLHPSFVARRVRGGLLSGHHLLSDLVVSGGIPRSGHQLVHAGDPDFIDRWSADLRDVAERDWLGAGRLAMAIHSGGVAIDSGGICVLFYLTDFPRQARWLQQDEIAWLENVQATEKRNKEKVEHLSLFQALTDTRILLCALVYFCLNAASYGVAFFLPTIIKNFGVSDTQTGLLAALPFVFGGIGMVLLGRHSDRTMERKGHVAVALLMAAIGIGLSGLVSNPIIVMALLCFAQIGVSAVPPMFWPLAGKLPDRSIGRCRDRGDQLAGQSVRFRRSICDGLSKGSDWQLYGRAAPAGRVRGGWRSRRLEPAH